MHGDIDQTDTISKVEMIASCKHMVPEEMETIIGGDDSDMNIPTFIDDE